MCISLRRRFQGTIEVSCSWISAPVCSRVLKRNARRYSRWHRFITHVWLYALSNQYVVCTSPTQLPLSSRLQLPLDGTLDHSNRLYRGEWVLPDLVVISKGIGLGRDPGGEENGSIESKGQIPGANNPRSPIGLTLWPSCLRSLVAVNVIGALVNVELGALSVTGSVNNEVKPYGVEKSRLEASESYRFDREPVLLLNPSPSNAGTNVLRPSEPGMRKTTSLS